MQELLKTLLGDVEAGRVLDVATGRGAFARALMEALGGYELITGIDIKDPRSFLEEDLRDRPDLEWIQADATSLPFPDGSFDLAAMSNSLHHIKPDRVPDALCEMLRVLRPGGALLIVEMVCDDQTPAQQVHVDVHHWRAAMDRLQGVDHYPTYTRAEIRGFLDSLGLTDLAVHEYRDVEASHDTGEIEEFVRRFSAGIDEIEGPDADRLRGDLEAIRRRALDAGLSGATELIVLGRR